MIRIFLILAVVASGANGAHAQSRRTTPPTLTPAAPPLPPPAPPGREGKPGEHHFYQPPPPEVAAPEAPSADGQWPYGMNTLPVEYIRTHRVFILKGKREVFVRVACHEGDFAIRGMCSPTHARANGASNSHADESLPVTYGAFRGSRGWVCEYDTSALPDVDDEAAGAAEAIASCVKRKDFMNYQFPARGRGDDF